MYFYVFECSLSTKRITSFLNPVLNEDPTALEVKESEGETSLVVKVQLGYLMATNIAY